MVFLRGFFLNNFFRDFGWWSCFINRVDLGCCLYLVWLMRLYIEMFLVLNLSNRMKVKLDKRWFGT